MKISIAMTTLAVAITSSVFLAGCDKPASQDTSSRTSITFLSARTDIADTTLRDFADNFEADNDDTQLVIEAVSDYANVLRTRLAAGEPPDIFRRINAIPRTDWQTFFLPLNDLKFLDDMKFNADSTLDGNVYAVSTYANYTGILYNKKAFASAGITKIPTTINELYAASEKLKEAGITPTTSFFRDKWPVDAWSGKLGPITTDSPDIWTPMGETDTPFVPGTGLYEAARIYCELYNRGLFENDLMGTTWDGFKPAFARGEFGWVLMETWLIPQIIEEGANSEDVGFFPMPVDNSGTPRTLMLPDEVLAVSRDTKSPEHAKKFIEYIMNDGYEEWLNLTGGFSSRDSVKGVSTPQIEEFFSFGPAITVGTAQPSNVVDIMNRAQIQWRNLAIDSISTGLEAAASSLNNSWARARGR